MRGDLVEQQRTAVRLLEGAETHVGAVLGAEKLGLEALDAMSKGPLAQLKQLEPEISAPYAEKADARREEVASKMGFSAYGVTQNDDPLSQAIRGLIDYPAEQDKQIAMLWQALEKMSQGQVNGKDCVPQGAAKNVHEDIEKLNKLID